MRALIWHYNGKPGRYDSRIYLFRVLQGLNDRQRQSGVAHGADWTIQTHAVKVSACWEQLRSDPGLSDLCCFQLSAGIFSLQHLQNGTWTGHQTQLKWLNETITHSILGAIFIAALAQVMIGINSWRFSNAIHLSVFVEPLRVPAERLPSRTEC